MAIDCERLRLRRPWPGLRRLRDVEAGEVAQAHDFGHVGIGGGEPFDRTVEHQEAGGFLLGTRIRQAVERQRGAAVAGTTALVRRAGARVVVEDAAHRLGGGAEEVRAVLPRQLLWTDEAQERFVHERRRLQRVAGAFAAQRLLRQRAQLLVDERQQLRRAFGGGELFVHQQRERRWVRPIGHARSIEGDRDEHRGQPAARCEVAAGSACAHRGGGTFAAHAAACSARCGDGSTAFHAA